MSNESEREQKPDPTVQAPRDSRSGRQLLGVGARIFFVVFAASVVIAALFGAPHILYSYHVSHFAILYVLTLATLAAFPDWDLLKTFWLLLALVTVLGVVRTLIRHHMEINFLDWIADLSGILGGLAPVFVQRLREIQVSGG